MRDLYWWGLLALFGALFTAGEAYAWNRPQLDTLSRFVFNLGRRWPLSIFLWGLLCGGLAVHFFWHWCPV